MDQQAEAHPSLCTDPGGGGVLSPAGHVGAMLLLLVVKHIRQDMAGTLSLAKPVLPRRKTLLASAAFASTPAAAEQQQRQHCVTLTRDQRKSGPCAPMTPAERLLRLRSMFGGADRSGATPRRQHEVVWRLRHTLAVHGRGGGGACAMYRG